MTTTILLPEGRQRYFNNDGTPAAGCSLYTYAAGTLVPKVAYKDADATQQHTNPIILDAKGEAVIFWSGAYKVDLKALDGTQITGYPVDNIRTDPAGLWGLVVTLLTSVGALMIGYLQSGVGAVLRTIQSALSAHVDVEDFGADPTGVLDSTAAFIRVKAYLKTKRGGKGMMRAGATFMLKDFDLDEYGIIFEGRGTGFMYAEANSAVRLVPAAGAVYVARLKGTRAGIAINAAEGSGFKNVQFHEPATGTCEYGLFIDSGGTLVESVQVTGFQYGCVMADQVNQNKFRNCNFLLNTKVGFAVTEHQGKAYLHPNVAGITAISNTTFEMRGCNIRQNGFGMILRSLVGASISDCVVESNDQAGIYIYRTDVSSIRALKMKNVWCENNYQAYVSGSLTFSIAGNNMLKITNAATYIAWTSLYQAGYQMVIDSQTHYGGGGDTMDFDMCQFNCAGTQQKSILILSGYKITFRKPWFTGGDTPNLVKITTDAEAVHWHDPLAGNVPTALVTSITDAFGANSGNRGAYYKSGTSFGAAELGGVYPILGVTGGPLHFLAPVAGDPRQADDRCFYDFRKLTAFSIAWRTASAIPFTLTNESNILIKLDRKVEIWMKGTLTVNAVVAAADKIFCNAVLPYQALQINHVVGQVVIKPTGGGAVVVNNGCSPIDMYAVASLMSSLNVFGPLAIGNTFDYEVQVSYYTPTL